MLQFMDGLFGRFFQCGELTRDPFDLFLRCSKRFGVSCEIGLQHLFLLVLAAQQHLQAFFPLPEPGQIQLQCVLLQFDPVQPLGQPDPFIQQRGHLVLQRRCSRLRFLNACRFRFAFLLQFVDLTPSAEQIAAVLISTAGNGAAGA